MDKETEAYLSTMVDAFLVGLLAELVYPRHPGSVTLIAVLVGGGVALYYSFKLELRVAVDKTAAQGR